ncbi:MAG: pilus assembly PilX N-terminal domain-containing protein [Syntrophomonadaceae bacterium]
MKLITFVIPGFYRHRSKTDFIPSLFQSGNDKGYVLVWVIFYLLLFFLIAASFADSSFLEGLISINHHHSAQAFEMAEAGVLVGVEEIYTVLDQDYSHSQDIPAEIILSKQEWILNESGKELSFYLENPKCVFADDEECRFQFASQGICPPAQRTLLAEVQVEFLDIYKIEADGTMVFDHRDYFEPARIVSLRYK